ncbi:unnamed protein product, partial [Polarella glacialis]
RYMMNEINERYHESANFNTGQVYSIVLLKCLKHSDATQALAFIEDLGLTADISCLSALLATCEQTLTWAEWEESSRRHGLLGWVQGAREAAERAIVALGSEMGHGRGWQRDALGRVALTMDLLDWHGLHESHRDLHRRSLDAVFGFAVEAVNAAAGGSSSSRVPLLSGTQLEGVTLGGKLTAKALAELTGSSHDGSATQALSWLGEARLRVRRGLPARPEDAGDTATMDDPAHGRKGQWFAYRADVTRLLPPDVARRESPGKEARRLRRADARGEPREAEVEAPRKEQMEEGAPRSLEGRGSAVVGQDAGCGEWFRPSTLDSSLKSSSRQGELNDRRHGQLLAELAEVLGLREEDAQSEALHGSVRLYTSYVPCLACLAALCQFRRRHPGLKLEVAFDGWRQTRHWTT